jgi:hypothetical protein
MSGGRLLHLDVGGPDHLGPLFGLFGQQPTIRGGRARKRLAAELGNARLGLGIGQHGDWLTEASEPAHGARQHPFQHAVAANEMVIERRADMNQNDKNQEPTHPAMDCE